jgi:hypothetical protein
MKINALTARKIEDNTLAFALGIDKDDTEVSVWFDLDEVDNQTIDALEEEFDFEVDGDELFTMEPIQAYKLNGAICGSLKFKIEEIEIQ